MTKRDTNGKRIKTAKPISPRSKKRPKDVNQLAHQLIQEMTEKQEPQVTDSEVSRVMAEMGRRGGKIGGANRAKSLSKAQRIEIALKAARARWDKRTSS